MPIHICCECGSQNIRILSRKTQHGLRWHVHCVQCTQDGGDFPSLYDAVVSCVAVPAEARVGGVLRGGHVVEDRFCYHGPGFVSVRMRKVNDLRLLGEMSDKELMEATK